MNVAIQGIRGSFHDQAAQTFFDQEITLNECRSFRDVFTAVQNGSAEFGVVAVENSLHGSINPVYRLLADQHVWVCGEVRLQIGMCLVGHTHQNLEELDNPETTVLSHFAAFGQCEQWLLTNIPQARQVEGQDTAEAVRQVIQKQDVHTVAIASQHAANLYGGTILQTNLNDDPDNYTRFFIIRKDRKDESNSTRTSIILRESTSDKPGTLFDALGSFAKLNINLTKLDSHPRPGKERTYAFYIDFDEALSSDKGKQVITELQTQGWDVQILGSYQAR